MRQPFSGTAGRIFMKLLPNDTGENAVCNVVPPPGEWQMFMICVIYAMTLAQSPEGATHGGCVINHELATALIPVSPELLAILLLSPKALYSF